MLTPDELVATVNRERDHDAATLALWRRAKRAADEVATWPWWKKGEPAPPEELPTFGEEDRKR